MDEYNKICALYDKLCTERSDSSFWAINILDATKGITQKIVWQNFYQYMANSSHEFTDTWQTSLGEQIDNGLTMETGGVKFKTHEVKNGNVTHIRMIPESDNLTPTINGEQVVGLSEAIPEETPRDITEASDEKCE